MAEHVIISTSYGSARADAAVPCVLIQWHGFANARQFITLLEAALVYFEQHATPARPWGWVGDTRQMGAIPDEAQRWLQQVFNPRVRAAGLHQLSVVRADSIFGRIATQLYAQQTQQEPEPSLAMVYYPTLEEAKAAVHQALR